MLDTARDIADVAHEMASAWTPLPAQEHRAALIRSYWGDDRPRANWCAAFVRAAVTRGGGVAPTNGRPVRGARAAIRWYAESGRWILPPREAILKHPGQWDIHTYATQPRPGDLICWRRGIVWQAHIAVILDYDRKTGDMVIAEGNTRLLLPDGSKSPPVATVRMLTRQEWTTRMRGLYGIARPRLVTA